MLNSKEVIWDGPSIPCLQLCKGDTVSDVIYNIANQICCIIDDLDINTVDYSCIIDKSKTYGNVDLFLFFSLLLENDCKIKDLLDAKIDANDTTELLADSLDLKCFLQPYLDNICAIIRFYNQDGYAVNPNDPSTVFQRAELKNPNFYYVSDSDQSVWIWNGIQYELSNLPVNCVCELEDIDLDVKKTLQVIIDNLCQTKSNGIIKACDTFKVVPFDTIDPNTLTTVFTGIAQEPTSYYISNITHKLWRWVSSEASYLPSILTTANINLASIDSCLLQSEIALQDWIDLYKVYQEPIIKSCLATTNILSNHIESVTDNEICSLQQLVGKPEDVYYSFIGPCTKVVNFKFAPNSPFMALDPIIPNDPNYFYVNKNYPYPFVWNGSLYVPYKETLANVERSQWEKVCDLLTRLKSIETTCCTPSCDNISVGFSTTYDSDDNVFTLTFDKASGTNIPEDFTDCGSILIATDKNGTKVSLNIELVQDVVIELDTSSLDLSSTVNVNIKSCLSNGSLTCKTCYSQSLPIIEKCGICKICAVDSSDTGSESVIVYYTLDSNPSTVQNTKLFGGQCLTFKLPEDKPTIKSIITSSSSISLESDPTYPCNDVAIPAAVADTCWFFEMPHPTNVSIINTNASSFNPNTLQFNFESRLDLVEDYFKYLDYVNTTASNISGKLVSLIDDGNSPSNIKDIIRTELQTPNSLPSNVLDVTRCSYIYRQTWNLSGQGSTGATITNNNQGSVAFVLALQDFRNLYNIDPDQNNSVKYGFVLRIQGQPTNINGIQKPEIAIKNPINNALTWIKGELLSDECECPS